MWNGRPKLGLYRSSLSSDRAYFASSRGNLPRQEFIRIEVDFYSGFGKLLYRILELLTVEPLLVQLSELNLNIFLDFHEIYSNWHNRLNQHSSHPEIHIWDSTIFDFSNKT